MTRTSRRPAEATLERMRPLAKLPIFFDLEGKRAVVAGGTAPAAWKAELLAAAGAAVEVYAIEPCAEMTALIKRGAAAGRIEHVGRAWTPGDLNGAAIALADAADDGEARRFALAAHEAGVPVNVIDNPDYCDFQFGSIVNRSPVVVSISTDGAAPILGQAIRRRIETLLPQSLASWAEIAKSIRSQVSTTLAAGPERRRFWERLSEFAFAGSPSSSARSSLAALMSDIKGSAAGPLGRVTLVGAGPGDAELLTLKAVRAMQAADVILFDDLVSADVLELARREAKRMAVGKRGDRESCSQDDINALMIKLAQQGKHVVRLKSGDPMIFGRVGEEMEELASCGIPVTVVPGITAASAMSASLGVSLTHRECAQSVRFVTGRGKSGSLPEDLDWDGLADPSTTLIVYMGGRSGGEFARRLMERGLSAATPVVIATSVSREDQNVYRTTLLRLADEDRAGCQETTGPVLIGIGATFAHRSSAERHADPSRAVAG